MVIHSTLIHHAQNIIHVERHTLFSNNVIINCFITSLAAPVGKIKRILCSDWLPEPSCLFDPAQEKEVRSVDQKSSLFLDNVGDKVEKKNSRGQSQKENIKCYRWFVVLQTRLAVFPGSLSRSQYIFGQGLMEIQ